MLKSEFSKDASKLTLGPCDFYFKLYLLTWTSEIYNIRKFLNLADIRHTYSNTSVFCLSSSNVNLILACYDCYEALKSFVVKFLLVSWRSSETSTFLKFLNNIKVHEQLKLYPASWGNISRMFIWKRVSTLCCLKH